MDPLNDFGTHLNFASGYCLDKWRTLRLGAKIVVDMRGVWCTLIEGGWNFGPDICSQLKFESPHPDTLYGYTIWIMIILSWPLRDVNGKVALHHDQHQTHTSIPASINFPDLLSWESNPGQLGSKTSALVIGQKEDFPAWSTTLTHVYFVILLSFHSRHVLVF